MATPGPTRGPEAAGPGEDAPPGEAEAGRRTWTSGEAKLVLSTQILGCEPPALGKRSSVTLILAPQ